MIKFIIFNVVSVLTMVSAKKVFEMNIGKGFSWKNCNTTAVPVYFKELSVSPNPIKYNQNIVLTAAVDVSQDIGTTATLKVDVNASEIYQGQAFDMCQYEPKLCHIKDVCQWLSQMPKCPTIVEKLGSNCHCPLKKKTYAVKELSVKIPNTKVQVEGQFVVIIKVTESAKPVGCLHMEFCLGECSID